MGIPDATSSADDSLFTDDELAQFATMGEPDMTFASMATGDVIDAEIVSEEPTATTGGGTRSRSRGRSEEPRTPRDAKTGPPSIDEWTGFFSRVVLRAVCDFYINAAFRGIDEESLSDREVERLAMTEDERKLIVVPFAELSNKSKFMRRHGRMIVASGDAVNSVIVLGAWMTRVNRIAAKYRPKQARNVRINGSSGQGTPSATQEANGHYHGTTGGQVPGGFPIFPGSG